MAVPGFQALMLPMLELLSDGQVQRVVPDVADELAGGLGLTDADREEMLPSGAMATFINRTHWAATYMVKAGLLHRPKRGHAVITKRGLQLLATKPDKVNIALLTQYPEFEEFRKKKSPAATPSEAEEEENPEESLARAFESWRKTVEVDLLDVLQSDAFTWQQFEHLVVDLLHAMGYGRGEEDRKRVTRMTGDDGIDGVIDEDKLGLDAVYIQAKNYASGHKVGRPDLQKFAGSLEGQRASKGVFITTSSFSADAREYVTRIARRIVLIDGETLASLMYDHGIGVRPRRMLDVKSLDEAYFEGEF
ncbi:MAG: restriction endonuclease [Chloroflexota bacterium]